MRRNGTDDTWTISRASRTAAAGACAIGLGVSFALASLYQWTIYDQDRGAPIGLGLAVFTGAAVAGVIAGWRRGRGSRPVIALAWGLGATVGIVLFVVLLSELEGRSGFEWTEQAFGLPLVFSSMAAVPLVLVLLAIGVWELGRTAVSLLSR